MTDITICPYNNTKETVIKPDGTRIIKDIQSKCGREECPFYAWKDWNKPGGGCTKARAEIEEMKRRYDF